MDIDVVGSASVSLRRVCRHREDFNFFVEFAHLLVRTECASSAGRHGLRFYFQDPKFRRVSSHFG